MPHPFILRSPLATEELRFESMTASAGLSVLGEMQLGMISEKPDLKPEDLLGKPVTVTVALRDESRRHFHGYVTRFGLGAHRGRYHGYQATVRPWLWFLTRTSDCRIFQEQTVPDIVKKVFEDHAIANFEFKLFRNYRKWTYCVQYRESDYNFVARLLEHEGIYWYFEHTDSAHKLVLVDSQSVHDAVPGFESLAYFENAAEAPADTDYISRWTFAREVKTGHVVTTSYDFERPSTSLETEKKRKRSYELSDYEQFDFQGDYVEADDGTHWADNRLDELQSRFELLHGSSNAQGLCSGHLLKMRRHPRDDQNAEYLVTSESVQAHQATGESGGTHAFSCDFSAMPSAQQFRAPRRTPKPFVQGPQTAMVVGPAGEELHTDKYGRVKVQFHWDRYGARDEKSSCWIRVSQPWAGKGWGGMSIPRIGQEVVVDFLEGDPDQPIITGRVYNAEQMPPFELPAGAVISGIKSKTHKGQGFNEMSMDDTPGKEKLNIHAQYDMATQVLHDQTNTVDNNRTQTIKVDDTLTVNANRTTHVKGKLDETVDSGQTTTIKSGYKQFVTGGAERDITGLMKQTVTGNNEQSVSGTQTLSVAGKQTETVSGGRDTTVTAGDTQTVNGARGVTINGADKLKVTGALTLDADGAFEITSPTSIKLSCKGSVVEISPSAITITFDGSSVKVDAAGVAVNGPKVSLNG